MLTMTTSDCEHDRCYCDSDRQQSGCEDCGLTRPRCTCGEWDEATGALDRLGVAINAGHPMQSPERQWRIVAAEMAALLSDEQLAVIRSAHYARVNCGEKPARSDSDYWARPKVQLDLMNMNMVPREVAPPWKVTCSECTRVGDADVDQIREHMETHGWLTPKAG